MSACIQSVTFEWSDRVITVPLQRVPHSILQAAASVRRRLSPQAAKRPERPLSTKTLEMCAMRIAGMKLRDIAAQRGISFQAVEQAIRRAASRDPELAARLNAAREERTTKPARVCNFKNRMFYWLRWAGYRHCWCCHTVRDETDFSPKARICRKCNAKKSSELYHRSEAVRERVRQHNQIHGRKYNQRYLEKLKREDPERIRELRRTAYLKRKARLKGERQTPLAASAGA